MGRGRLFSFSSVAAERFYAERKKALSWAFAVVRFAFFTRQLACRSFFSRINQPPPPLKKFMVCPGSHSSSQNKKNHESDGGMESFIFISFPPSCLKKFGCASFFLTHFSIFGNPDKSLFLVFDFITTNTTHSYYELTWRQMPFPSEWIQPTFTLRTFASDRKLLSNRRFAIAAHGRSCDRGVNNELSAERGTVTSYVHATALPESLSFFCSVD